MQVGRIAARNVWALARRPQSVTDTGGVARGNACARAPRPTTAPGSECAVQRVWCAPVGGTIAWLTAPSKGRKGLVSRMEYVLEVFLDADPQRHANEAFAELEGVFHRSVRTRVTQAGR